MTAYIYISLCKKTTSKTVNTPSGTLPSDDVPTRKSLAYSHQEKFNPYEMTTCRIKECGKTNLAKSNMVQGLLPNKGKIIVLVDSGTTKTLISMSTIENSSYL